MSKELEKVFVVTCQLATQEIWFGPFFHWLLFQKDRKEQAFSGHIESIKVAKSTLVFLEFMDALIL